MARRFFYICAGMFLLALPYHLGARDAAGQAKGSIEAVDSDPSGLNAVVDGSYLIFLNDGTAAVRYPLPVPGPVVGTGNHKVVYRSGDVYVHEGTPGAKAVLAR